MARIIILGCILFFYTGCHSKKPVELSDDSLEAIQELIREAVAEEISSYQDDEVQKRVVIEMAALEKVRQLERKQRNQDQLVNTSIGIASDTQAWKMKPRAFGGGADEIGFTGAALSKMGYSVNELDDSLYESIHGDFYYRVAEDGAWVEIEGINEDYGNKVVMRLNGTRPKDIVTEIMDL